MFFRRRRHCGLFQLLLLLLGVKAVTHSRPHLTDEGRQEYRAKARRFRTKMREAYAVWDDEEADAEESTGTDEQQDKD
ncbi:hypothetical protein [Alicyclobacillus sp. ALC3]|uniref:hypothetical protein n=1 Tax=Alicyclobacillus sp. ALC3 TaxID=2796143 RepID=UPI00237905D2|nr:hypothetical protein [Alicyclobacillus sp. ALC3]WDL97916.1 hypothetical protein JC200_04150 [Alicyclobacillus sp. ALC3]